jgi:uncharacterized membrane protein YqjE
MAALRAIGATLNEAVRVRGALFYVELREEARRGRNMLALALIGAAFLHIALSLAAVLVAAVFWDTHRVEAIGLVALLYAACGGAALARLRAEALGSPAPFEASRAELARDLADLRR